MFPWHVTEDEIKSLIGKGTLFHEIMAAIIRNEAIKSGIPQAEVITTYESKPDGGVDLEINPIESPFAENQWFVLPKSIWQFKAERPRGTTTIDAFINKICQEIKTDIEAGKYIAELLNQGYKDYALAWAYTATAANVSAFEKSIKDTFHEKGFEVNVRVINAKTITDWLDYNIDLCCHYFNKNIGNLELFQDAYRTVESIDTSIALVPDPQRKELIAYIVEQATLPEVKSHIRIEGTTGVGKTRISFEAIKRSIRANAFFYANEPGQIPDDFFIRLKRSLIKPDIFLIIDECEDEFATKCKADLSASGCNYLLITINRHIDSRYGDGAYSLQGNQRIYLEPLEPASIEKIIKSLMPEPVNESWVQTILRLSKGFVKLAVILTKEVVKNPNSPAIIDLMRHPTPENALKVLIEDEEKRRLMQYIALFTNLGWDEDLVVERDALIKWANLGDGQRLKEIANEMQGRGLVVKKGRYRYVTPDLFAIWLATDLYKTKTKEEILALLNTLPNSGSKKALIERLADLGEVNEVKESIIVLFEIFSTLDDIDSEYASSILSALVKASPEEGKKKIRNLILTQPKEKIQKFTKGKNNIVWSLRRLAWNKDSFDDALEVLFTLAVNEKNERDSQAQDAIDTLYQTHLSGTEVSLKERLLKLAPYISSREDDVRRVTVNALASVFQTWQTRASFTETGRLLPKEYTPSNQELIDCMVATLDTLLNMSMDASVTVSKRAKEIILSAGRTFANFGQLNKYIEVIIKLHSQDNSLTREIRQALETILRYEDKILVKEQRESIKKFITSITEASYSSRVQRWLGNPTHEDWDLSVHNPELLKSERYKLAEEAFVDRKRFDEIKEWIFSQEAKEVWQFAFRLGQLDKGHDFLNEILYQMKANRETVFYPAYVAGWSSIELSNAEKFLLEEIKKKDISPIILFDLIWRNDFFEHDWIIDQSIFLVKNNSLPSFRLQAFRWTKWLKEINKELFSNLLKTCMGEEDLPLPTYAAIGLLDMRFYQNKNEEETKYFADIAKDILVRKSAITGGNQMDNYEWHELAETYKNYFPIELTKAILDAFCSSKKHLMHTDYPIQLLHEIVIENTKECWPIVGDCLLKQDECAMILQICLGDWFANGIDTQFLLDWAKQNEEKNGHIIVASMVKLIASDFKNSLARKLLVSYPNTKDIKSLLIGSFLSGGFSGPISDHTKNQIKQAELIKEDDNTTVRKFAEELIGYLKKQLTNDEIRDEEWGLK